MKNYKQLDEKIEALRIAMYQLYEEEPESEELLRISQKLDETLNEFRRLKKRATEKPGSS